MSEIEPELQYLDLCFHYEPDSHEKLVSMVEHLTGLNPPDDFSNQSVNVDIDDVSETEVMFSNDTPLYPEGYNQSSFMISVSEGDQYIHTHIYSEPEYIEELLDLVGYVLGEFGPTAPTSLSIIHTIDSPVVELGVGSSPDGTRLSGVRFYIGSDEYIFGEWESKTSVRCTLEETEALSAEDLKPEIDKRIEQTKTQIMEVIDGS